MDEAINAVEKCLEAERHIYEQLLSLADQQKQALVSRRAGLLMDIAARQAKLLSQARGVEVQSREAIGRLAARLDFQDGAPSVALLARRLSPDRARRLQDVRAGIVAAASRLTHVNRINAELFECELQSIRFTIDLLAGKTFTGDLCYAGGEPPRRRPGVMVDRHA